MIDFPFEKQVDTPSILSTFSSIFYNIKHRPRPLYKAKLDLINRCKASRPLIGYTYNLNPFSWLGSVIFFRLLFSQRNSFFPRTTLAYTSLVAYLPSIAFLHFASSSQWHRDLCLSSPIRRPLAER